MSEPNERGVKGGLAGWAPCVLGGVLAGCGFLWFAGPGARWIAGEWFFAADWPVLPPAGWFVAAVLGCWVTYLCHLARSEG